MQHFIIEPDMFHPDRVLLTGDEHHHATRSCRVRPGELIGVSDGRGRRVIARIDSIDHATLTALIEEDISGMGELPVHLTIAMAVIKPALFELVAEKSTELGVRRIVPLVCERGTYAPERLKRERIERIVREAAKQSGRSFLPVLDDCRTVGELLTDERDATLFVASCDATTAFPAVSPVPDADWVICVGPEGDFTADESALFHAAGATAFSLGGLVLRAETAGISACAVASSALIGSHGT